VFELSSFGSELSQGLRNNKFETRPLNIVRVEMNCIVACSLTHQGVATGT